MRALYATSGPAVSVSGDASSAGKGIAVSQKDEKPLGDQRSGERNGLTPCESAQGHHRRDHVMI
jgi:hypothetical protein